jgi:hypothetical protein
METGYATEAGVGLARRGALAFSQGLGPMPGGFRAALSGPLSPCGVSEDVEASSAFP